MRGSPNGSFRQCLLRSVQSMHRRHSVMFFFYTRTRLANQSGWRISLMNLVAISFVISFLIVAFLSGEKCHDRCFTGLDPSLTLILCSANSFGTPGMSAGFQANISLLSRRNLVSVCSYFAEVSTDGRCLGGITDALVNLLDIGFFRWCKDARPLNQDL
jgi:hypothetical protein